MEGQNQRRKSFIQAPTIEVIFEGSKTYWKARTTLEILIAFHSKQACYEVIVFHPDVGKEAPRIYLSAPTLASKIDQKELQQRIAEKKEVFIRSKKPVNVVQISKECLEALIVQFVLNRLNIIVGSTPDDFVMAIVPQTGDVIEDHEKNRMDVELAKKPDNVVPLESSFQKKVTNTDIMSALQKFQSETKELQRATYIAEMSSASIDGLKNMMQERLNWRKKYNPVRLRWMKAINRVMVQIYIEKVKLRLEKIYANKEKAAGVGDVESKGDGLTADDQGGSAKKGIRRPKILRKSIDNSSIPSLGISTTPSTSSKSNPLPIITHSPTSHGHTPAQSILKSVSHDSHDHTLPPLLLPPAAANMKRRSKSHVYNKPIERRSFDMVGGSSAMGVLARHSGHSSEDEKAMPHLLSDSSAPSLLQSYHSISNKHLAPIPMQPSALYDMHGSSKSVRVTK